MNTYTIEDKYNIYKGKELLKYNGQVKIYFIVVGYMKGTKSLIGKIRKDSGLTGHFSKPKKCDFVYNHNTLNKYISTMSEDELKLFVEDAKQLSNDSNAENSI